jgi:hypothetical protein
MIRGETLTIVADRACDDDKLRGRLESVALKLCFPRQRRRDGKRSVNRWLYRARYRMENCFCRLKRWASIDTSRDNLASRYLSLATFACGMEWLRFTHGMAFFKHGPARLLALNAGRAAQERLTATSAGKPKTARGQHSTCTTDPLQGVLL